MESTSWRKELQVPTSFDAFLYWPNLSQSSVAVASKSPVEKLFRNSSVCGVKYLILSRDNTVVVLYSCSSLGVNKGSQLSSKTVGLILSYCCIQQSKPCSSVLSSYSKLIRGGRAEHVFSRYSMLSLCHIWSWTARIILCSRGDLISALFCSTHICMCLLEIHHLHKNFSHLHCYHCMIANTHLLSSWYRSFTCSFWWLRPACGRELYSCAEDITQLIVFLLFWREMPPFPPVSPVGQYSSVWQCWPVPSPINFP